MEQNFPSFHALRELKVPDPVNFDNYVVPVGLAAAPAVLKQENMKQWLVEEQRKISNYWKHSNQLCAWFLDPRILSTDKLAALKQSSLILKAEVEKLDGDKCIVTILKEVKQVWVTGETMAMKAMSLTKAKADLKTMKQKPTESIAEFNERHAEQYELCVEMGGLLAGPTEQLELIHTYLNQVDQTFFQDHLVMQTRQVERAVTIVSTDLSANF